MLVQFCMKLAEGSLAHVFTLESSNFLGQAATSSWIWATIPTLLWCDLYSRHDLILIALDYLHCCLCQCARYSIEFLHRHRTNCDVLLYYMSHLTLRTSELSPCNASNSSRVSKGQNHPSVQCKYCTQQGHQGTFFAASLLFWEMVEGVINCRPIHRRPRTFNLWGSLEPSKQHSDLARNPGHTFYIRCISGLSYIFFIT